MSILVDPQFIFLTFLYTILLMINSCYFLDSKLKAQFTVRTKFYRYLLIIPTGLFILVYGYLYPRVVFGSLVVIGAYLARNPIKSWVLRRRKEV